MKPISLAVALCLTLIGAVSLQAQDEKAKAILDELSTKTRKYHSITSDFEFVLEDKMADLRQSQEGVLKMQGKKFQIRIGDNTVYSDGDTRWTYNEDMNEVYIDHANSGEEAINPTEIYTIWETGFKHYYNGEVDLNGQKHHLIKLNPKSPEDKTYHTVNIFINSAKMEVSKMEIKGKQGDDYTYMVKSFKTDKDYPASTFVFNKGDFPGVEEIDNR